MSGFRLDYHVFFLILAYFSHALLCFDFGLCVASVMVCMLLVCQVSYEKLLSCLSENLLVDIFGSILLERRIIFCAQQLGYDSLTFELP